MIAAIVRVNVPVLSVSSAPGYRRPRVGCALGATRLALVAATLCVVVSAGCRRSTAGPSNACERAQGEWVGDDIESPNAEPAAIRLGRAVVEREHWWISARYYETDHPTGRARERIDVVERGATRCTVTLTREGRRRTMVWNFTPDGRLRARAPNGLVTAILRRVGSP